MNIESMIPIESERLLLDRFKSADWERYYQIELTPEQHRFNSESFNPRTKSQIMDYVRTLSRQNFADCRLPFRLAIRLRSEDVLIGFTGLKNGTLETNGSAEVFYSIYRDFWNNGYGTEALRAIINFGIKQIGLHRIFAGCDIDNLASKRTMEKAGMHFESMWRQDRMRNGRWTDGLGYSIISDDV